MEIPQKTPFLRPMKYIQTSQTDFICMRACVWSTRGRHGFLVRDTGDSRNSSVLTQQGCRSSGSDGDGDGDGSGTARYLTISSSLFALRVPASKSGTRASYSCVARVRVFIWTRETDRISETRARWCRDIHNWYINRYIVRANRARARGSSA